MRNIFVVLFAFILASCGSNTSPENGDQYPFQEQTWRVDSGEHGTYIGVNGTVKKKMKADSAGIDTIRISSPLKYGLEIQEGFMEGLYAFQFIDSTVTQSNAFADSIGFPRPDSLFGHRYQGMHISYEENYSTIELNYPFECGKDYKPENFAYINYKSRKDTTKIVRVYTINVRGALETINHIVCEN